MYFRVVNSVSRKNDPWIKMRLTVRRKDTSSCSEPPSLASSAILGYAAASDLFNPSEHPILSFFCYPHSHAVLLQLSSHVLVHSRVCMLRRGGGGGGGGVCATARAIYPRRPLYLDWRFNAKGSKRRATTCWRKTSDFARFAQASCYPYSNFSRNPRDEP